VEAFQCEDPVFTSVQYTGTRYEFSLGWTSNGNQYFDYDPSTTITLYMDIYDEAGNFQQTEEIFTDQTSFDMNDYLVNLLNYNDTLSSKNRVVFRLKLTGNGCDHIVEYDIPANSY